MPWAKIAWAIEKKINYIIEVNNETIIKLVTKSKLAPHGALVMRIRESMNKQWHVKLCNMLSDNIT